MANIPFLNNAYFAAKVGIGTDNPSDKLDVQNGYIRVGYTGGAQFKLVPHSSNDGYGFYDVVNTNYDMWFDGGNVGIGTTSPGYKLQINDGNVAITGGTSSTLFMNINTNQLYGDVNGVVILKANDNLRLNTNGAERVRIINNGSVGIGTPSPTSPLTIKSNSTSSSSSGLTIQSNGNTNNIFELAEKSGDSARLQMMDAGVTKIALYTDGTDNYINSGNVGIGTDSPARLLSVDGIQGWSASGTEKAAINPTSTGTDFTLIGNNGNIRFDSRPSGNSYVGTGNFGIGTTSPSEKLHVHGKAFINGQIYGGFGAQTTSGTLDWNDSTNARSGSGHTLLRGNATNGPAGTEYYHPFSWEYSSYDNDGNMTQFAIPYSTNNTGMYYRSRYSGTWTGWAEIVTTTKTLPGGPYLPLAGGTMSGNTNHSDNVKDRYGTGNDFQIWHDGSNTFLSNEGEGHLNIINTGDDRDIVFKTDDGSGATTSYMVIDGSAEQTRFYKDTRHTDNVVANFGNSDDLQIYHDGSNSYINQVGVGKLVLQSASGINIQATSGETRFTQSGVNSEIKIDDASQANKVVLKASGNSYFNGGNVGIGTTSPSGKLQVDGGKLVVDHVIGGITIDTVQEWNAYSGVSGNTKLDLKIGRGASNKVSIFQATYEGGGYSDIILQDQGGNVGIGTTSPGAKLEVNGVIRVEGGTYVASADTVTDAGIVITEDDYIYTKDSGNLRKLIGKGGDVISIGQSGTSLIDGISFLSGLTPLYKWYNNASEIMRLNATGLGIGTTSPTSKLDIRQSTSGGSDVLGTGAITIGSDNPYWTLRGTATSLQDLAFDRNYSGTWYESMRIQRSTGNIGIGTTSPTAKLHVAGTGLFTGLVSGITPVAAANFVTKAYVDGSGGGTGPFLPLAGGTMTGTSGVVFPDSFKLNLGTGSDLEILHDGADSIINNNLGHLYITQTADDKDIIFRSDNGSGGVTEYLFLDGSQTNVNFQKDAIFTDGIKALFGGSGDLQIYHDGSNSYVNEVGAGDLYLQTNGTNMFLRDNSSGNTFIAMNTGTADVVLKQGGATRLTTTSTGVSVTGAATATTFLGDLNGTINTATTAVTQANAVDNETVATTAYVNNKIGLIPAGLVFQGTWNAATNTPTLASGTGTTGNFYIVSVAGSTNLDGITDWKVGDWAVFIEQGASDQWEKIDNSSVLDGIGTGLTLPLWAGSGTSNTLDDSIITQSNTSASAIATISSTSDYQLRLHSTNTWSGIQFDDNGPAPSTIWHNATYGTFALGGGGSNVSGKKLHVHGAASIGSSYAASAAPSNGLIVEGNVGIGTISPSTKLEVAASATTSVDIAHFSNSNDVVKIKHALDGLGSGRVSIFDASNNEDVRLSAQSNSWFNAGNVGIGTTSPVTNLTVVQSGVMPTSGFSATQWVGAFVNTGAVDRIARVGIYSGNNSFSLLNFGDVDDADIGGISYSNIDNSMALRTNNGERLLISSAGAIKFNNYNSTNNTGTPTYLLGTDASGNVVKTNSAPSPITSQADSLYDLIPNGAFTTTYAFTSTAGTYAEVMKGDDVITDTGTYTVQAVVNDFAVGGTQYDVKYSGIMSWHAGSTNDTGIGAVSEISLHRAGHASNSGIIYLRTRETGSTEGNELKLEIMCNRTYSAASNVVFKFVRLI